MGRCTAAAHERGYTLPEILVVLVLVGLTLGSSVVAWQNYRRASAVTAAVATVKMKIDEARMLSVYRVIDHWVVINPAARTVRVVEDSGANPGVYEADDEVLSASVWPGTVELGLPSEPSPLPSPIGTGNVTAAWGLPLPASSTAWTTGLVGVALTPEGRIRSAEATPAVVGFGAIVFRDANEPTRAAAVGVEGLSGTVRAYKLDHGAWQEL